MLVDNNTQAFLALVNAGLWETEARLSNYGAIDYSEVMRIAEEQSVVGLVAAGLEHVLDVKVPKPDVLQFVGQSLQLEQQNTAMNYFIGVIVEKMRKVGIYTLLVKGQGIAQCYCKPLWRSCGDVDFFLDESNYHKAFNFLSPLVQSIDEENPANLHLGMTIDPWVVELHGTLRCGLGKRIDTQIDTIQDNTFKEGRVRAWRNGDVDVFLPAPDNDVIFVFTHILQHFFKGGIGLRQICDWCRLLWTYRETIDVELLERRLRKMRLMSEWKAFAAMTVDYLGMPVSAMPLYDQERKWRKKGEKVLSLILEKGNFGHNRDLSYINEDTYLRRKIKSFNSLLSDSIRRFMIFPCDSIKMLNIKLAQGIKMLFKGK